MLRYEPKLSVSENILLLQLDIMLYRGEQMAKMVENSQRRQSPEEYAATVDSWLVLAPNVKGEK